jgi:hypothetical protein
MAWNELLAPDRAEQTHRILGLLEGDIRSQMTQRAAAAGLTTNRKRRGAAAEVHKYSDETAEYYEWHARAVRYQQAIIARISEARAAAKAARIARAKAEDAANEHTWRAAIAELAENIAIHQQDTEANFDPTSADRLLWARLDLVHTPGGGTLRDLTKRVSKREPAKLKD